MGVWPAVASFLLVAVLLAAIHRPLGDYMARFYASTKDLAVERSEERRVGKECPV